MSKSKPVTVTMYKVWNGWLHDKPAVVAIDVSPFGRGWKAANGARPSCFHCRVVVPHDELYATPALAIAAHIAESQAAIQAHREEIARLEKDIADTAALTGAEPKRAE